MNKLKIPKKEAKAVDHTPNTLKIQLNGLYAELARFYTSPEVSKEQANNSAILYADAHNTYNKCHKLPSELMQENEELKATLTKLVDSNMCSVVGEEMIQELLTKHSQQS